MYTPFGVLIASFGGEVGAVCSSAPPRSAPASAASSAAASSTAQRMAPVGHAMASWCTGRVATAALAMAAASNGRLAVAARACSRAARVVSKSSGSAMVQLRPEACEEAGERARVPEAERPVARPISKESNPAT